MLKIRMSSPKSFNVECLLDSNVLELDLKWESFLIYAMKGHPDVFSGEKASYRTVSVVWFCVGKGEK